MKFVKHLLIVFLVSLPIAALATDLGQLSRIATNLMGEVSDLGNIVLFITGGAFLISSMIKFQQYKRSPQFTPISRPITELVAGIVLIALPFIMAVSADNALFKRSPSAHPYTNVAP
jgi:uncharacterized membrane protein YidH (DUF202 family)